MWLYSCFAVSLDFYGGGLAWSWWLLVIIYCPRDSNRVGLVLSPSCLIGKEHAFSRGACVWARGLSSNSCTTCKVFRFARFSFLKACLFIEALFKLGSSVEIFSNMRVLGTCLCSTSEWKILNSWENVALGQVEFVSVCFWLDVRSLACCLLD